MTTHSVTVTAAWDGGTAVAEGNYQFVPSGSLVDAGGDAVSTPVIYGTLDTNGALSVSLLASDNYSAGVLTWDVKITVQGFSEIDVSDVAVDYTNGASQLLFTILEAAGWTPTVT